MSSPQLQSHPFFNPSKTNPNLIFSKSPLFLPYFSTPIRNYNPKPNALSLSLQEFPPNALRRKTNPQCTVGFSLGVDLGSSRTGLALSKGFSVRPLTVLKLRGQKLELQLLDMAEREEVDEFIIGIPKSWDGKETPQSNKVRSIAGRLAVRAAERGLNKSARQKTSDAYAAVILLERYFAMSGEDIEIVLPKQIDLQEKLRKGTPLDIDFSPEEFVD
ncbi:uncharacterized protein LOC105763726 isoform X3 [Gossypium raimondii]|uniref:YqgF/RNase H-like domain-containing protein n=1 Tax=Gossypium raimondii TaxID=29730 RepID=A0A0D2PSA2_GOSRA|nr:uncharacterized protein LOC105763726 isoform X3 [Gossypium raimondii]KJB49062.1 hypothetical protein B456_008G106400 [Gossypium raimondii]